MENQETTTTNKNKNLFRVLERGDVSIAQAYSKAIILVGYTRVGKSTVFNWLLRKQMRGAGTKRRSVYELAHKDEIGCAEVGETFNSVTMDPNIHPGFNQQEEVSLIDMAGFKDSRDHVGAIAVSYFIKSIFDRVRQAKFILVIPEGYLGDQNGQNLIKTFQGFIDMFPFAQINQKDPTIKNELFKSLAMVVTKAKKKHQQHEDLLYDFLDFIKSPEFQKVSPQNKIIMKEIVNYLIDQNRIFSFQAAVLDKEPEKPEILEYLKIKEDFFDLDAAESRLQKTVITLPIEKDFQVMPQKEQEKFRELVTNKIQSYKKFGQVLKTIDTIFLEAWDPHFQKLKNLESSVKQIEFNVDSFFQALNIFKSANDVYESKVEDTKMKGWKISKDPLNFVSMLSISLKLHEIVVELCVTEEIYEFGAFIDNFSEKFSQILQIFVLLARNREDLALLSRLSYVLERGLKEFNSLHSVKPEVINDVSRLLPDALNDTYDDCRQILLQKVITQLNENPDLFNHLFKSVKLLQDYENEILNYQFFEPDKWTLPSIQFDTFLNKQRSTLKLRKANLNFLEGKKEQALPYFVEALKNYNLMARDLPLASTKNVQEIQVELDELSEKRIELLKTIVDVLINPSFSTAEPLTRLTIAQNICKKANLIEESKLVFQKFIDSEFTDPTERLRIYSDYAQFCGEWGLVDKGLELYHKKLSLQKTLKGQKQTVQMIKDMIKNRDNLIKDSLNRYNDWQRLPEQDADIDDNLDQISYIINQ